MKRHIKGDISGSGRFDRIVVQDLIAVRTSGHLEERFKSLEQENVELRTRLDELTDIVKNLNLGNLKDVLITEKLHDGDTIGWDSTDKKWVIFGEGG